MNAKWIRSSFGKWPRWLHRSSKHKDGYTDGGGHEELQQSLLKNLECPVCMDYMTPPIIFCNNGHNICSSCRPNLDTCPTCRQEITQARNFALEDLCHKLKYPCKFRDDGCKEMFTGVLIKEHQAVCNHGNHDCLLNKIPELRCGWKGPFRDLITHLESQHEDMICHDAKFSSPEVVIGFCIILLFNEIFLYYKCFQDGKCFSIIQIFGTAAQASKYKYKAKFFHENQIEKSSQVFLVRSITEDFETSFRTGRCVRLDDEQINHYVVNGILNMTMELKKVQEEVSQDGSECSKVKKTDVFPPVLDHVHWPWRKF